MSTDSQISVADAKNALRQHTQSKAELNARIAAGKEKIVEICGGKDLREITEVDPARARKVAGELAVIQAQLQIDQVLAESIDAKGTDLVFVVLADSIVSIERIRRTASANLGLVIANVTARLKALAIYEEARLPRLVDESLPVRAERGFNAKFEQLDSGGGRAFRAPDGGDYWPDAKAEHVLPAHDRLAARLAEMEAHTAELRKRLRA